MRGPASSRARIARPEHALRACANACTLTLTLLAITATAAFGHDGHSHDENNSDAPAAVQQDATLQTELLDRASDRAPDAVGGRCTTTIAVPGQGPSCQTADDAWLVKLADGSHVKTHGPDSVAATYTIVNLDPATQGVLDAATSTDAACTPNARTPHYQAVYARPSNAPDRSATIVPELRRQLLRASAYLDLETRRDAATRTAKLRLACTAGSITVTTLVLPPSNPADTFATVTSRLQAAGLTANSSDPVRYVVYYDAIVGPGTYGWAGYAHIGGTDSPLPSNTANNGGYFAINYAGDTDAPTWYTLLHEMLHNMGAVQSTAPESSGQGHCTTDADVMCYQDTSGIATTSVCTFTQLDCGANTYFNAATPTPGSYLDSHWNLAAPANRFLDHGPLDQDHTPPTTPTTPTLAGRTATTLSLTWSASVDDRAVTGYRVEHLLTGGWQTIATSAATSYTVTQLAPMTSRQYRVIALDATAHEGPSAPTTQLATLSDTTAPSTPAQPSPGDATTTSVTITWPATSDDVAVDAYNLWRQDADGNWILLATLDANTRSYTVVGLAPATDLMLALDARDAAGNTSSRSALRTLATLADLTPPTAPLPLSAVATHTSITLTWLAAIDDYALDHYSIESVSSSTNPSAIDASETSISLTGLAPATAYTFLVWAVDHVGNRSATPATFTTTTLTPATINPPPQGCIACPPVTPTPTPPIPTPPATNRAPSTPTGIRMTTRTRASVTFTWARSTDETPTTLTYRVYRRVGTKWVLVGSVKQPPKLTQRPTLTVRRLSPRSKYQLAIEAIDAKRATSPRRQFTISTR